MQLTRISSEELENRSEGFLFQIGYQIRLCVVSSDMCR